MLSDASQPRGRGGLIVTNYRDIVRELRRIEPGLAKALRKDIKTIAEPVRNSISGSIPINPPTSGVHKNRKSGTVSGFKPIVKPGRLTWGANYQNGNVAPKTVKFAYRPSRRLKEGKGYVSLARLEIPNAAAVVADMAGSSNKYTNKKRQTREYDYSRSATGVRRHRINGQGFAMIRALKRRPSRFVYPAVERTMPLAINKAAKTVQAYAEYVNINMRTR